MLQMRRQHRSGEDRGCILGPKRKGGGERRRGGRGGGGGKWEEGEWEKEEKEESGRERRGRLCKVGRQLTAQQYSSPAVHSSLLPVH